MGQQDVNIISMSKWGKQANELTRGLTTCSKKAFDSETAELHRLRRCHGDVAVLDIVQEIYDQPYNEWFTLRHQWVFSPYEDTGSRFAEDATWIRRGGKGCTWRVSAELLVSTPNELQPLIKAHVFSELRKEYDLSVHFALAWMASHQGLDLISGRCGGVICTGFLSKLMRMNYLTTIPWSFFGGSVQKAKERSSRPNTF